MGQISKELSKVFDNTYKIIYNVDNTDIDCMCILLAMALTPESYSAEILGRMGLSEHYAKSYVAEYTSSAHRNISSGAEKAILKAEQIAHNYGYNIICSHHLLLALAEGGNIETAQIMLDYNLSCQKIREIVEAMCHNNIGMAAAKDISGKNIKLCTSIKNKRLEKEILSALSDKPIKDK